MLPEGAEWSGGREVESPHTSYHGARHARIRVARSWHSACAILGSRPTATRTCAGPLDFATQWVSAMAPPLAAV